MCVCTFSSTGSAQYRHMHNQEGTVCVFQGLTVCETHLSPWIPSTLTLVSSPALSHSLTYYQDHFMAAEITDTSSSLPALKQELHHEPGRRPLRKKGLCDTFIRGRRIRPESNRIIKSQQSRTDKPTNDGDSVQPHKCSLVTTCPAEPHMRGHHVPLSCVSGRSHRGYYCNTNRHYVETILVWSLETTVSLKLAEVWWLQENAAVWWSKEKAWCFVFVLLRLWLQLFSLLSNLQIYLHIKQPVVRTIKPI